MRNWRRFLLIACLATLLPGVCPYSSSQAQVVVYDVSPTMSLAVPNQVFDVEIRVATSPPNLDLAQVSVHVIYDASVVRAASPLSNHSAGNFIPDGVLQLTGDYGWTDGTFEYQVVAVSPKGATETMGIVSRHAFRAIGNPGQISPIIPVIVEMLDSENEPIGVASMVNPATVTIGDPPTPTPSPTPSPTPTPTATPIVFTTAPLATDPGSVLWQPDLSSRGISDRNRRSGPIPTFESTDPSRLRRGMP